MIPQALDDLMAKMLDQRADERIASEPRPAPERRLEWGPLGLPWEFVPASSASRYAVDAVLYGEVQAWIFAEMRRRAARALCMPDPTDDRPMLVLLAGQPHARDNGVYVVGENGELVRHRAREKPAPWWRGAVASTSVVP